jgi:peptidoglycan/LPS O-acetylase OafA/YrhL
MLGIGVFRLLLAVTVVITHTHSIWGFTLGNPVIAVRVFFIISGFYMTMVLREKYQRRELFWINRLLKIYPIYWITLFLTIVSCILAYILRGNWGELADLVLDWQNLGMRNLLLILLSQLSIFGRGIVMFGNFVGKSGILYLLIPQAWTLVLELWFYFLVPWIVMWRWWQVVTLGVLSVVIRSVLVNYGCVNDLWTYRFFPTELVYFLMGMGGYYIYKLISNFKFLISKKWGIIYLIIAVGALSTFNFWGGAILLREWWLYLLMMILIPFLFWSSKESSVDRVLGDMSYPVYIVHILVNNIVNPLLLIPLKIDKNWQSIVVTLVSIVFGLMVNRYVLYPIEKIRSRISQ